MKIFATKNRKQTKNNNHKSETRRDFSHATRCEQEDAYEHKECENDDDSDLRGRDSIPTCEEDTKKAVMQEETIRDFA